MFDANRLICCRLFIVFFFLSFIHSCNTFLWCRWIKRNFCSVSLAPLLWLTRLKGNKTEFYPSLRTQVLPDPGWSGTQSSLLCPAAGAGWKTLWKCGPRLQVRTGTDTAACCDASLLGRCLGMSPGQNSQLDSTKGERRPLARSQCSHRQTWKRKKWKVSHVIYK